MNEICLCPICKTRLIWYMGTLVCTKCDDVQITDLTWQKRYMEECLEE